MKKVSVVIPNYNGEKFLDECLNCLAEQTTTDFNVIIIDNNSQDGSLGIIENYSNSIDILTKSLDRNYGFAKAVNIGIKEADSEYVILLNNDAYADKNFISELIKAIEKDINIFSVQAMMIQNNYRDRIDSAGDFFSIQGWSYARGKDKDITDYNRKSDIFSSCAGAAIYRKAVFDKIGYFDETFFTYLEDVDLGYRAKLLGYRNVYAPKAKVYHVGSATSGSRHNEYKVKISARNMVYLLHKNLCLWQKILNFIFILGGIIGKTIYFSKKRLGKAYISGIFEGLRTRNQIDRFIIPDNYRNNYFEIEKELFVNAFNSISRK